MGGQQSTVSEEEMQNLSQKAGRSVPTTPMEGSVVGGNKDQAKMMGSSASLRSTFSTPEDLQTQRRREQVRTEATAAEEAKLTGAESLKKLSSLEERVQGLAAQKINQAGQAVGAVNSATLSEAGQSLDPEAQQLLADLQAAAPNSPEALQATQALNQKLGRTGANLLTPEEIKSYYSSASDQLGSSLAQNTADNLMVTDLDLPSLGFTDNNELASVLGLDSAEMEGLNLTQLQEKIAASIQDNYTQVSNLETQANDMALSPAERAQARKSLREMGAVGVRTTETAIDKLADQIESADTVQFNGKEMKVEELLSDDMVSGLAAKFLDKDDIDGDDWKTKFKEENPDLAQFLTDNAAALESSIGEIDDSVKEYAAIQQHNKEIATDVNGQTLSNEVISAIVPRYGELSTEKVDVENNTILKLLKDPTDKVRAENLRTGLEAVAKTDPTLASELSNLSMDQLRSIGILDNGDKWKAYTRYLDDSKKTQELASAPVDQFFNEFMGKKYNKGTPLENEAAILKDLDEAVKRGRSGFFGDSPLKDLTSKMVGPDGRLLPLAQIKQNLSSSMTPKRINDLLSNPGSISTLSDKMTGVSGYNTNRDSTGLYDKLKSAFTTDDKITRNEWYSINKNLSKEDYDKVYSNPKVDDETKKAMEGEFKTRYANSEIGELLKAGNLINNSNREEYLKPGNPQGKLADIDRTVNELENMKNSIPQDGSLSSKMKLSAINSQINLTNQLKAGPTKEIDKANKEAERKKKVNQLDARIAMARSQLPTTTIGGVGEQRKAGLASIAKMEQERAKLKAEVY